MDKDLIEMKIYIKPTPILISIFAPLTLHPLKTTINLSLSSFFLDVIFFMIELIKLKIIS